MSTEKIADEVKFAYWVPNVSGGLVTSEIEQRTNWEFEYNKKLAQTAERVGFETPCHRCATWRPTAPSSSTSRRRSRSRC